MQEVTGTEQAAAGAGGELLNAFNVATFKNEEDDTAFWNRLIPSTDRAAKEEEPQELGIRAARLKTYDEVGPLRPYNDVSEPLPHAQNPRSAVTARTDPEGAWPPAKHPAHLSFHTQLIFLPRKQQRQYILPSLSGRHIVPL